MPASKIRFSAAHMFYCVVLSASAVSLFRGLGLAIAALVLLVWWQVLSGARRECESAQTTASERAGVSRLELVVGLLFTGLLIGILLPAHSDFDPMQQARNSMRQVSVAIASYEAKHNVRLPAVVYDSSGKPMHSWRALILAELGEDKLAAAYHLDEPWDSPNNAALAGFRPWHYQPFYPSHPNAASTGVRTPSQPTPEQQSQTHLHLVDGLNRNVIVEHESMPTHWLEPCSLDLRQWQDANRLPSEESGFWDHGILVSTYRGRLAAQGPQTIQIHPAAQLAQVTRSEFTSAEQAMLGQPVRVHHLGTVFRILFFVAVVLYPLRWLRRIRQP